MPTNINSLWPAQIRVPVQSPWAILNGQAEALGRQTAGLLLGEIRRREVEEQKVALSFDIVVPALNGYRHRILTVSHDKDMLYPAVVDAELLRRTSISGVEALRAVSETLKQFSSGAEPKTPVNRADSDQELIEIVAKVLRSPYVISTAQSLIARASDALAAKEQQAQNLPASPNPELPAVAPPAIPTGGAAP